MSAVRNVVRASVLAAALVLGLLGCRKVLDPGDPHSGPDVTVVEGGSVALADGARLGFERVLADSRCPADVVCVWEGQAQGRFVLVPLRGAPVPFDLEIRGAVTAADTVDRPSTRVGAFRFTLMELSPYPIQERDPIKVVSTAIVRVE